MKNSKFWIWFIPLFLIFCFGLYTLLNKTSKVETKTEEVLEISKEAKKIKDDYEKLNDESPIKVSLSINNSYFIATKEHIEELFNNNNGIIYFGEVSSYASRKSVSLLNDVLQTTSLNKIYYLNIAGIDDDYLNYLKDKLDVKTINAGDTYMIKDGKVINSIKVDKYDNDKELTKEEKETITKEYQDKILDLIEKCDESC